MLDDIIKIFQAIPLLTLSPASCQEFLRRTGFLTDNLCIETFNLHVKENPPTNFSYFESRHIQAYLAYWPELIKELNSFLDIIHLAWYDMYQQPMGGDDILPILVEIMPGNKSILEDLVKKFYFAANVDRSNPSTYYLTVLGSAAEHVFKEVKDKRKSQTTDTNNPSEANQAPDKYAILIKKLREPAYYNLLFIIVTLSNLYQSSMNICAQQIYASLKSHNNNNYNLADEAISEREKKYQINENIKKMVEHLNEEPFKGDIYLTAKIHKHVDYQDFLTTLGRTKLRSFLRLVELSNKLETKKADTTDYFENIDIELTSQVREFLGIPTEKKLFSFLFFTPQTSKMPLNEFIGHLSRKIEALEELREKNINPEFIVPEPEQLAQLLRQSL